MSYQGHGRDSISPEVLQRFAPPSIPSDVAGRLQAYLDLRAPNAGLMTNDGKSLFFTWGITGILQVFKLERPMGFPIQMTGGQDATSIVATTEDNKYLLLMRDRMGEEYPGLYLQSTTGGELRKLYHEPKVKLNSPTLHSDDQTIFYCTNETDAQGTTLIKHDIFGGKRDILKTFSGMWGIPDYDIATNTLILGHYRSNVSAEYYTYQIDSGDFAALIGQNEEIDYQVKFGAKKGEYIVKTDKFGDFHRLYRYDGTNLEAITDEIPHDIEQFSIDDRRTKIFYMVNKGGYAQEFALDAKTFAPLELPSFAGAEHVWAGATTPNGRYTVFVAGSSTRPAQSMVYDWQTRELTKWTSPSTPEINLAKFVSPSLEKYPSTDGVDIPMFVYRPKDQKTSKGIIVNFHGGPESQSRPLFSTVKQFIIEQGFTVVEPNVRGSSGYGKAWQSADDGPKRLEVISDIKAIADHIKSEWKIGGKTPKVGVMGGSYGGYSTLMAMTYFAGTYDAGVSMVGISSLVTFLKNTAPYRRKLRAAEYGDLDRDLDALEKLSPINYTDRICAPLLIIQGATDPRVPAGEAIQMYEYARSKDIPAECVIFPDEGHGVQKRHNIVTQYALLVKFFSKHLAD